MKRTRMGNYYYQRDRHGRFTRVTRVGRSLAVDRRRRAKRIVRPGYGHRGDLRRRRRK